MKRSKFAPEQISRILKKLDYGKSTDQISRDDSVSKATFYKSRQRYGGFEASELKRLMLLGIS